MMSNGQKLTQVLNYQQSGQLQQAELLCRQMLQTEPSDGQAWYLLGVLNYQMGQIEGAAAYFEQATRIAPEDAEAQRYLGRALKRLGRIDEAVGRFQQAMTLNPDYAEAHHHLGITLGEQGRLREAIASLRRAIQLNPSYSQAHYNLGLALQRVGDFKEAVASLRSAVTFNPENPAYQYSLGAVYIEWGKREIIDDASAREASSCLKRAVQLEPENAQAHYGLGIISYRLEQFEEAIASFRQALALQPDYALAYYTLGCILGDLSEIKGGLEAPLIEAIDCFRQAIQRNPKYVEAYYKLGLALSRYQDIGAAREAYELALKLAPDRTYWKLERDRLCSPIPDSEIEITRWRSHFENTLNSYSPGSFNLVDMTQNMTYESNNLYPPFELAYQAENDRPLKEKYARLFAVNPRHGAWIDTAPDNNRCHVAFLVTRYHEIGFKAFVTGIINHLSRARFKVSVICHKSSVSMIQSKLTRPDVEFITFADTMTASVEKFRGAHLDLVYYWEVGSDQVNYFLPFFRVAPVQCTSWGSPTTTGIPEMDYFISSSLFEPQGAQEHYSEKLVTLNSPGLYYQKPDVTGSKKERAYFGLSNATHIYFCTQNLKKVHPEFDYLIAKILQQDPDGKVFFKEKQGWLKQKLLARWRTRIPDVVDRIEFVPYQSFEEFLNLVAVSDVLLDTIHYSGGTTSYEAIAIGAPIVTWPREFMRGRMTYGCYQHIGVLDTVAWSAEEYVAKAVQLANDKGYQTQMRQKILSAGDALFEDMAAVRELEQFFAWAIGKSREATKNG